MRNAQHFVLAIGAALILVAATLYHVSEHRQTQSEYQLEQADE
jgi:hypothetical protein